MDTIDCKLLNLIQRDFPVSERPYLDIGHKLGLSEEDVIKRLAQLKEEGLIRRLGANFDSRKLGYYSTLCAAQVEQSDLDLAAKVINSYRGVTHNYLRGHRYNIWFTLIAPTREDAQRVIEEIKAHATIKRLLNLPATRFFKIKVEFDLEAVPVKEERYA